MTEEHGGNGGTAAPATHPTPRTAPSEAARLRALGFNIIPIRPGEKIPRAGEGDIVRWRDGGCDVEIQESDNIAMLHGGVGGTWAMDCDDRSILADLLDDYEQTAPKLCVVRTPKQGHHLIFKRDPSDTPPGDPKYEDKRGRHIDIKSIGYTLLPPSVHPERHLGQYAYQFDVDAPNVGLRWSDAVRVLRGRGFFSPQDREETMKDVMGSGFGTSGAADGVRPGPGHGGVSKYDYNELLRGGFGVGERRRKQNSLYIKKRIMGSTAEDAEREVRRINGTCNPPLQEREIRDNVRASEHFYQMHKNDFDLQWQESAQQRHAGTGGAPFGGGGGTAAAAAAAGGGRGRRRNALDMHMCADTIMHETRYRGHPSGALYYYAGGIWIQGGEHKLRKSCELRWREYGITHSQIREIEELVKIRTAIVPDGTGEDAFDRDATKIVLQNGTYDLERGELVEHSPEHKATIRHPIAYDVTAGCPVFDRAMDGWFGEEDVEYKTIILEMFALSVLRKNIIQKGYVHYGKGSNGKSTCLAVLRQMLGPQNTASIEMQAFEDSRFIGDELYGKSANISSDGGTQPLVKTGLIKAVLGGDSITCEPKYKRAFVFQPFCTMIFTFNELPPVLDSSDGFARKIQLVPWQNKFDRGDPEIAGLPGNESERAGLFNKLVPIMRRFLLDGGRPEYEDSIEKTLNLWMKRSDSFFLFREEYLVRNEKYQIEVNKLNTEYSQACGEHGMTPLPRNEFYARMSEWLGGKKPTATKVNGENARVWKGVTVRSELRAEGQAELGGGA
ncbi:MAG: phage/plasmid primase, P4 family [Thaumarchaeota archaeon]|nr:phage/plasmid primase, P4 family [Nitrososphaerota archaeon]